MAEGAAAGVFIVESVIAESEDDPGGISPKKPPPMPPAKFVPPTRPKPARPGKSPTPPNTPLPAPPPGPTPGASVGGAENERAVGELSAVLELPNKSTEVESCPVNCKTPSAELSLEPLLSLEPALPAARELPPI